jgi:hypothetical protein
MSMLRMTPPVPYVQCPSLSSQVQIKTSLALYELSRPAQKYRKSFNDLQEQLEISRVVYGALSPEAGGSVTASLDEVVAKMARAKVGRSVTHCAKVGRSVTHCAKVGRSVTHCA